MSDDLRLKPNDTVYVNAPARNSRDSRPCVGECVVVSVFPNHVCGPCVMVRDEHGDTTVYERYTIPLALSAKGNP